MTTITTMGTVTAVALAPIIDADMNTQRLAIPVVGAEFCEHFGRATEFLIDDPIEGIAIEDRVRRVVRCVKPGQCESVPGWLKEMGVGRVLAFGIGPVAIFRLNELGIAVTTGVRGKDPLAILRDWLAHPNTAEPAPCAPDSRRIRHCQEGKRKSRHE